MIRLDVKGKIRGIKKDGRKINHLLNIILTVSYSSLITPNTNAIWYIDDLDNSKGSYS